MKRVKFRIRNKETKEIFNSEDFDITFMDNDWGVSIMNRFCGGPERWEVYLCQKPNSKDKTKEIYKRFI